jgi:lysophospholipase L1-like esterase
MKKIRPLLAIGAGSFLVLAAILGFAARQQYASALAIKVFPQNGSALKLSTPGPAPILMLGDSRIAAWDCSELAGKRVINAGFPGITSAQLASGCGRILEDTHPKIVVVQVGINDLKLIGVRLQWRERIVENCISNILSIVDQSKKTGARVIVTTIWPVGRLTLLRRFVWNHDIDAAVDEANSRLKAALVSDPNAVAVDLFSEMTQGLSQDQRLDLYTDTLHLKPAAYEQLTSLLAKILPAGL